MSEVRGGETNIHNTVETGGAGRLAKRLMIAMEPRSVEVPVQSWKITTSLFGHT